MKTKRKSAKRQVARSRQHRRRWATMLVWGGAGVVILVLVGLLARQALRPAAGEIVDVPINSSQHIAEGTPPGPYTTDPPAGGVHYPDTLPARFYDESNLASLPKYPEGYLVHNLEHGHVIFWYNCDVLSDADCIQLKDQIRSVMDEFNGFKVVAFPWKSLDVPLVMTSWGRIQRFEAFDLAQARNFVRANRNRAPEPEAP